MNAWGWGKKAQKGGERSLSGSNLPPSARLMIALPDWPMHVARAGGQTERGKPGACSPHQQRPACLGEENSGGRASPEAVAQFRAEAGSCRQRQSEKRPRGAPLPPAARSSATRAGEGDDNSQGLV